MNVRPAQGRSWGEAGSYWCSEGEAPQDFQMDRQGAEDRENRLCPCEKWENKGRRVQGTDWGGLRHAALGASEGPQGEQGWDTGLQGEVSVVSLQGFVGMRSKGQGKMLGDIRSFQEGKFFSPVEAGEVKFTVHEEAWSTDSRAQGPGVRDPAGRKPAAKWSHRGDCGQGWAGDCCPEGAGRPELRRWGGMASRESRAEHRAAEGRWVGAAARDPRCLALAAGSPSLAWLPPGARGQAVVV